MATVTVRPLDAVCADLGVSAIDFIKVDVEGHELAVLQGMTGLLDDRAVAAIQLEFDGTDVDSRTFVRDFVRLLEPRGYRLHRLLRDGMAPVTDDVVNEVFWYANRGALRA
jgi:hypothetical protein